MVDLRGPGGCPSTGACSGGRQQEPAARFDELRGRRQLRISARQMVNVVYLYARSEVARIAVEGAMCAQVPLRNLVVAADPDAIIPTGSSQPDRGVYAVQRPSTMAVMPGTVLE
jgi:hypothetical protein